MGYRERRAAMVAERAAPHLEPGERVQTGFIALTGSGIFTVPAATFVVTDRAILVVDREGAQRLPRDFHFGDPAGFYHRIEYGGAYKVHRQFYPEVNAANEALRQMRARGNPPQDG
ncbi:hypothetical protein ACOQFV_20480 [Nocardiopsis changdeensis]|uniref:Uncharacterized protein n=1 Tax=Nocardiopsis changdeensis TaxID=2831969 RepID=A0ABX8BU56_9ACTN|nr:MULTISPECIES: hypothetical protein [Nocardiopsis]QUX25542.1 hypothetical protein KGD84_15665 [Nocardiopsis changdeensis]QYX35928.1 hypothetical protein K1J57_25120 [Nocardiopsis sp. MT53]